MRCLLFMLSCLCAFAQDVVDVALYTPLTSNQIFDLGPKVWLMADVGVYTNGTTIPDDKGRVQTWTDISGNGNSLVQSSLSSRPFYRSNYVNGLPSVDFGGSFVVPISNALTGPIRPPHTVFVTCYLSNVSGTPFLYSSFPDNYPYCFTDSAMHLNNQLSTPVQIQNFYCLSFVYSSNNVAMGFLTNCVLNMNGKKKDCRYGDLATVVANGLTIGSTSAGVQAWKGTVQEFIWFDRILNEHYRKGIELYMKKRWALQPPF